MTEQFSTVRDGVASIPGWGLRVALGVAAAVAAGVALAGVPGVAVVSLAGIVMMLLVLATALAPGSVAPLLLLIGLVIYRLLARGPALDVNLALMVLLLPMIHQLAGIAAAVPVRAQCAWAVLRPAAVRWLIAVVPVEIALLAAAIVV